MAEELYPAKDIKVFAILGVVALLIVIALPVIGLGYVIKERARFRQCQKRSERDPGCAPGFLWSYLRLDRAAAEQAGYEPDLLDEKTETGLGEEGSACGGEKRLPCKPGLECLLIEGQELGVCAKVKE